MSFFLRSHKNGATGPRKPLLIAFDLVFIFISMAAAYVIRSRFIYFVFSDLYLAYCLPYVLLSRFIVNLAFDFYSLDLRFLSIRDISKIYLINLIPTFLFCLIRVFSPVEFLRIPFSMIFAEYFFTVLFISLSRIVVNTRLKKRSRNGREFMYQKSILLLLNQQFSTAHLVGLHSYRHVTILGILSENQLLWGTDFQGYRVIGGFNLLEDLLEAHNRDLLVAIDETLDERTKIDLYAEIIEGGAFPVVQSNGRFRYPSLHELLDDHRPVSRYVPVEIENWLKTKSILLLGRELHCFGELVAFFESLPCRYHVVREVDLAAVPPASVILDLRALVSYEAGVLRPDSTNELVASSGRFSGDDPASDYVLVAPVRFRGEFLFRGLPKNATILYVNDYFISEEHCPPSAATPGRCDRSSELLASIFKALYCNREQRHRSYYFNARDKIDFIALSSDPRYSFLLPAPQAEPSQAPHWADEWLSSARPTAFTGLYWSDQE